MTRVVPGGGAEMVTVGILGLGAAVAAPVSPTRYPAPAAVNASTRAPMSRFVFSFMPRSILPPLFFVWILANEAGLGPLDAHDLNGGDGRYPARAVLGPYRKGETPVEEHVMIRFPETSAPIPHMRRFARSTVVLNDAEVLPLFQIF